MGTGVRVEAGKTRLFGFRRDPASAKASPPQSWAPPHDPVCRELDCVRALLPRDVLLAAEERAAAVGVGADRVLITSGALDEDTYLRALADYTGAKFELMDGIAREICPIDDERLIESGIKGMVPLMLDEELCLVVAPRGLAARKMIGLIDDQPARARQFRFTSSERLTRFVLRYAGATLATRASNQLRRTWPLMSAVSLNRYTNIIPFFILGLGSLASIVLAPTTLAMTFEVTLTLAFLAWLALRLVGIFVRAPARARIPHLPDRDLPTYSVIAALYHEAASVDGLLSAIERLDYPREKLDVILAVEADDHETLKAIAARRHRIPVAVIPVPNSGPRTKPKALNVALPFARGPYTVIYDAEDCPQSNQLRHALHAFQSGGDGLACVQARLCIDNTADGWLAGLFTAEYAGQFDVFLPGLSALKLPLPLGGSSNHFVTETLRDVCGWDPHNVTEDADLGMRLARFGYRSVVIDATTYEEAPAHIGPWLRQRTRWFKGWIQTWLVHMRRPYRLAQELGLAGFLSFQLVVGGNVLGALVHPLFLGGMIYAIAAGKPLWRGDEVSTAVLAAFYGSSVAIGYLTSAFLAWLGLKRRGLLASARPLIFTPVHWLLLSVAAWRAVWQFAIAPHRWEKTAHGLARNSRVANNMARSLVELERHLSRLKESGQLAALHDRIRNTCEDRRPLRRETG